MELLNQEETLYRISEDEGYRMSKRDICLSKMPNYLTEIPEQWHSRKFEDITNPVMKPIADKLLTWNFQNPVCAGIISPQNGIGKTHLATCVFKKFIYEDIGKEFDRITEDYSEDNYGRLGSWVMGTGRRVFNHFDEPLKPTKYMFLSEKKLALQIQESFNQKTVSQLEILESYTKAEFLVIDDLFSLRANEFARQNLFYIIDERTDWNGKPTFITSNLSLPEIADIDTRIADRVRNSMLFQVYDKIDSFRRNK